MAKLITPNKSKHHYVVGIDFGHGETSAAICPIEWDKDAGLRELNVQDIDLDRAARKKVITSSICRASDGIVIGEQAFEHMTDNNGIRVCFKQRPESLEGEPEKLMMDFMKAVYSKIRENCDELTDDNHVVYIARPSGWIDEEAKELYRQMALQVGIPLAGLTSESRAAIFYAKTPRINFTNDIAKGAIVFDLGSSTLDFTYLSSGEKPIDFGYNLGASKIDEAILENMILSNPQVKEFEQKYPQYRDALKFEARKFKEYAYSRSETTKSVKPFSMGSIIQETEPSYEDYADLIFNLKINNLSELNEMIESKCHYIHDLDEALLDFKNEKIKGKTINGVFLTGGASRMNFIRPLISQALEIPIDKVKIDGDNPSLTISRGIAMLGATDATTFLLRQELQKAMRSYSTDPKLITQYIEMFSDAVANKAWETVDEACSYWINNGRTTDMDELQGTIEKRLKVFQNKIPSIMNDCLMKFLSDGAEDIRKQMNAIIGQYEPGREITYNSTAKIAKADEMTNGLVGMSSVITSICESVGDTVKRIVWDIIITILFGFIGLAIKGIISLFKEDSEIRKDKAQKIRDKKYSIISETKNKVKFALSESSAFKATLSQAISNYYNDVVEHNLKQVIIPIE